MNVCAQQPNFLPYVGFWNRVIHCPVYIAVTGVNYEKEDFQNRVKLLGSWLTLPLNHKTCKVTKYVEINNKGILLSIAKRIESGLCVKRFKYHYRLYPILEYLRISESINLVDIDLSLIKIIASVLGVNFSIIEDKIAPDPILSKTKNICCRILRHVKNPVYYAGIGTASFLDKSQLEFPVLVQKFREGVFLESIVQLIAQELDPIDYISTAATWSDWC